MNPLTNVKNITKLNETELASGSIHKKSWHDMYKESAWIFIGGLEYGLTEGDVLAVFSQYGEIVNINLVRDKKTGKSKGYCFICYANQKSTVLAVDNFNGIKLCNRTIRVDHVANYKPPKENDRDDEITKMLKFEGCAPQVVQRNESNEVSGVKIKKKKSKKDKKEKKKKRKKKNKSDASEDSEKEGSTVRKVEVKEERHDPGYDKYDIPSNLTHDTVEVRHHKRNLDNSRGESSHSYGNYRSKVNKHSYETEKDNFIDKDKIRVKSEIESDKDNYIHTSSSAKHKRQRSASLSGDSTQNHHKVKKHKQDESNRHSNPKRKHKTTKASSSSSSDDGSSSESSEDDKHKRKNRHSRKEVYKTQNEKRSFQEESRDKNSAYMSKKSRYHKTEKYSQHKSKTNYESDESNDTSHKISDYHRSKHYRK